LTPENISHDCIYSEYEKRARLLVFKNFVVDDYGEDYVCVTNDYCYLVFHSDGTVEDRSTEQGGYIQEVYDLLKYELEIMYSW